MASIVKQMKDPKWFIGLLWPVVLTVPYLPGIPKPWIGGLAWRQELTFAAILLTTFVFVFRRRRNSQSLIGAAGFEHSPVFLAGALFTAWAAASIMWAANPFSAAHYAFSWGAYLLFFALMHYVAANPRAMRASFFVLGGVVWLLSISCLIEWLGGAALNDQLYRANLKPIFRGFSGFGETMAVAAPIFAALALSIRKPRLALLSGATSLVAWLVILQAFQRAPIVGAVAAFVALFAGLFLLPACRPRYISRAALLATGFVLIGTLQVAVFPANPEEKLLPRLQATTTSEENTRVRFLYWGVGLEMFRSHPFKGVGANNYEVAFPQAREQFAAANPGSALVGLNEQLLTQYAHNEYVQILAELGIVGMACFGFFCLSLVRSLWRALRRSSNPLLALGAGCGLVAFAISSAASAFSFRWFSSGLMCFFAAALLSRLAATKSPEAVEQEVAARPISLVHRLAPVGALMFSLAMFVGAGMQAMNGVSHAWAQTASSPAQAEDLYRRSLRFNPFDAATHFDYGSMLYHERRYAEAVAHLDYAISHGINTSTGYAALAAAREEAGDLAGAERTLAVAVRAYPRSVFILVRRAAALSRLNRTGEADKQFADALAIDSRAARGWYQLINFDIDAALSAAQLDSNLAKPGELKPQTAVFVVLKENERRLNIPAKSGWRGRVGALAN
jgi:O-antigen ligase